jgi:hypothetical protein
MRWDIENITIPVVQIGNIETYFFNSFLIPTDDQLSYRFNATFIVNIGGPEEYNYWNEIRDNSAYPRVGTKITRVLEQKLRGIT